MNGDTFRLATMSVLALVTMASMSGCRVDATPELSPELNAAEENETEESAELPSHGFIGLTFENVDTTPLVIKEPVPGSFAAEVGIREGDLLIGVADRDNPTFADVCEILVDTVPAEVLSIQVLRDGEPIQLNLQLMSFDEVQTAMEAATSGTSESK